MRSENRESKIFAATEEAVRWSADEFNYLICVFSREDTLHHNGVAILSTNRVLMMARGKPAITLVICNSRILCIHIIWYRFSSFSSSSSFLFSSFHLRSSASKVRSYRFCYYNCRIKGPHAAKATGCHVVLTILRQRGPLQPAEGRKPLAPVFTAVWLNAIATITRKFFIPLIAILSSARYLSVHCG